MRTSFGPMAILAGVAPVLAVPSWPQQYSPPVYGNDNGDSSTSTATPIPTGFTGTGPYNGQSTAAPGPFSNETSTQVTPYIHSSQSEASVTDIETSYTTVGSTSISSPGAIVGSYLGGYSSSDGEEGSGPRHSTATVTWADQWTTTQTYTLQTTSSSGPETVYTTISYPSSYVVIDCESTYTTTETVTSIFPITVSTAPASPTSYPDSIAPYPTGTSTTWSYPEPTNAGKCIPCEGQPGDDPEKWCGFDINTNWYENTPITCRTVFYDFHITNETIAPDGIPRTGLVVNGQMPGPMLTANWGDTVVVTVYNDLPAEGNNGTTIHWHGLHQNYNNENDGVPSITQCPIIPGQKQTYTWTATSYGSSWYHSHYSLQTWEGIFGPIVINGPAAMDYDEEQFIVLQDWSHETVDEIFGPSELVGTGGNVTLDTGLINGKNVWPLGPPGVGERFSMTVTPGKTYRLRVLNSAIQSAFKFYIDQHEFYVIATDFVPIMPYKTNLLSINIGQRYDIIFTADQPVANYWMRSDNQQPCGTLKNYNDIKAIIRYEGAETADPTSTAYGYEPQCVDEPLASLVPIVSWDAGVSSEDINKTVLIGADGKTPNLYRWTLSGSTFQSDWGHPTLESIYDNGTIPDYSGNLAIQAPNLGEWVYVIIDTPIPVPHPIHLHGHDFLILAQGFGSYNASIPLNTINPPRRDVAVMPADPINNPTGGFLVIAFYTNNPGVWLLHCHIGWHVAMGFALQIIENLEGIKQTIKDPATLKETCASWADYAGTHGLTVTSNYDSGV